MPFSRFVIALKFRCLPYSANRVFGLQYEGYSSSQKTICPVTLSVNSRNGNIFSIVKEMYYFKISQTIHYQYKENNFYIIIHLKKPLI